MVLTTETAATNVSFRARTTTGVNLGDEGTSMPAARWYVHADRIGCAPAVSGFDAIGVESTGLRPFANLGFHAWSPPS